MIKQINVQTGVETTREYTADELSRIEDGVTEQSLSDALPLNVIAGLESTITPRRLRDALANDAGKSWVAAVEAKIATERGKL
jgi:hypothetical protein